MGTLIASHLSKTIGRVNILTRWREHRDAIEAFGGVRVEKEDDATSTYDAVGFEEEENERETYDTIFILTKSSGTRYAANIARKKLSENGLVVTLQNGIVNDFTLSEILGRETVVAGVTSRGASVRTCGIIRDAGGGPTILRYPSYDETSKKRTDDIARILNASTFRCEIASSDREFDTMAWTKLCANAVINPLTAISNVRNGDIDWAKWDDVALNVLRELRQVASARNNIELADEYVLLSSVKTVAQNTSTNHSSMLQDIDRNVNTEIDYINGFVVKEAERFRINAEANQYLWDAVKNLHRT